MGITYAPFIKTRFRLTGGQHYETMDFYLSWEMLADYVKYHTNLFRDNGSNTCKTSIIFEEGIFSNNSGSLIVS